MPVLALLTVLVAGYGLLLGSTPIGWSAVVSALFQEGGDPTVRAIVRQVRLPGVLTAAVAGAGLSVCGLMMQTQFRNPLAGPGVLGLSSGAGLGMALVLLTGNVAAIVPFGAEFLPVVASITGAALVLLLILAADRRIGDGAVLLIIGVMIGHLCSALVQVLQVSSHAMALQRFILWGTGSFAGVPMERLPWLAAPVLIGLTGAFLLIRPLNALLLGDTYARSLGVDVRQARTRIILLTALIVGTVTAYCGPVAFLGLATPHLARGLVRTADHTLLLPTTAILGALLGLICDLVVRSVPGTSTIPLNAVTGLLGAPVVLWVLLRGRGWQIRKPG